jgi:hypothetical protein
VRRRWVTGGATLLVALGLTACGAEPGVGVASKELAPRVQAIRSAAAAGDAAVAAQELAALRQAVARMQASGELDEDEAARVLGASAAVEAELAALPAAPSTASTAATLPTPTSSAPATTPPAPSTASTARPKGGKDKPEEETDPKGSGKPDKVVERGDGDDHGDDGADD